MDPNNDMLLCLYCILYPYQCFLERPYSKTKNTLINQDNQTQVRYTLLGHVRPKIPT